MMSPEVEGYIRARVELVLGTSDYGEMLKELQPRVVNSEHDYNETMVILDQLMQHHTLRQSDECHDLVDLYATLLVAYEQNEHPLPRPTPAEFLAHVIDARNVTHQEVVDGTGIDKDVLAAVLDAGQELTLDQARRLAAFFHVQASLLLGID